LIQQREPETNEIISAPIVACMKAGLIRKLNVDVLTYRIVLVAHGWALKSWYFKSRLPLGVADRPTRRTSPVNKARAYAGFHNL
jgi:hypothetical protein